MLSITNAERHYAECHHAECRGALLNALHGKYNSGKRKRRKNSIIFRSQDPKAFFKNCNYVVKSKIISGDF
jgi:hypothetical protein